jgi:hypothetical protein
MNICGFSKRSGLVKLKEHQMRNKITDFFPTYCQIITWPGFISPKTLTYKMESGRMGEKKPRVKGLF